MAQGRTPRAVQARPDRPGGRAQAGPGPRQLTDTGPSRKGGGARLQLERGAGAAGAGRAVFGGALLGGPELVDELLQPRVGGRAEAELVSPRADDDRGRQARIGGQVDVPRAAPARG